MLERKVKIFGKTIPLLFAVLLIVAASASATVAYAASSYSANVTKYSTMNDQVFVVTGSLTAQFSEGPSLISTNATYDTPGAAGFSATNPKVMGCSGSQCPLVATNQTIGDYVVVYEISTTSTTPANTVFKVTISVNGCSQCIYAPPSSFTTLPVIYIESPSTVSAGQSLYIWYDIGSTIPSVTGFHLVVQSV